MMLARPVPFHSPNTHAPARRGREMMSPMNQCMCDVYPPGRPQAPLEGAGT